MSEAIGWLLVPALLAWSIIAALRASSLAERFADHPNERSLHAGVTPRLGGIGLMVAGLAGAAFAAGAELWPILACAGALAALSLVDDAQSLPVQVRLPGHFVAAIVAVLALASPDARGAAPSLAVALAAVFALVWMANLFNFMDGADGLAGGMALIGFGALAAAAGLSGDRALAAACAAIASAAAGFLAHNFPPARVFLGDSGSVPLGFLAGAFAGYGALRGAWPPWLPLVVFSPFIVDATVTILARLARGENLWRAHRSHAYQRLVLSGWSHRRLALAAYALMLAAAASALAAAHWGGPGRWDILLVWVAVYAVLALLLARHLARAAATGRGAVNAPRG